MYYNTVLEDSMTRKNWCDNCSEEQIKTCLRIWQKKHNKQPKSYPRTIKGNCKNFEIVRDKITQLVREYLNEEITNLEPECIYYLEWIMQNETH
jgi:hypothetical protein